MKNLLITLLLCTSLCAGNKLDFLSDVEMKSTEMLVKLKKNARIKASKDSQYYYANTYNKQLLNFRTKHTSAYVVKDKLIWAKVSFNSVNNSKAIKDAFIKEFGQKYSIEQYKKYLKPELKYHAYVWKRSKGRSITLSETERKYTDSEGKETIYIYYQAEFNNYAKVPSQRGSGKKTNSGVLLRVPISNYYYYSAFNRALSYTIKKNFHDLSSSYLKPDEFDIWKEQKLAFSSKSYNTKSYSNLYSFFNQYESLLGRSDDQILKSRGFGEFKRFIYNKLISHRPLVVDVCVVLKGEEYEYKDSDGKKQTSYRYPYEFSLEHLKGRFPKGADPLDIDVRKFSLLIVGLDTFNDVATISMKDGSLIKIPLKELYPRTSNLYYF